MIHAYRILLFLATLELSLFAENVLLKNNGIVDIGRTQSTTKIEVPKREKITEPKMQTILNIVAYQGRNQSTRVDCETDFLGTTGCPIDDAVCPSFEEFANGSSIQHHIIKTFQKYCPTNTIKDGSKCFLDKNRDGKKDIYSGYLSVENKNILTKTWWNNSVWDDDTNTQVFVPSTGSKTITIGAKTYFYLKFITTGSGSKRINQGTAKINGKNVIDYSDQYKVKAGTWEFATYSTFYKNAQALKIDYSISSYDPGTEVARPLITYTTKTCSRGELVKGNSCLLHCPTGFINDGDFCSKKAVCPLHTKEQSTSSCIMEYNWYSYECPSATNIYEIPWKVINSGMDCGNPSCTNNKVPPSNNCARVNYSCPTNNLLKCNKTITKNIALPAGFILRNGRSERIIPYCGKNTYNAVLDICENITKYTKLCSNPNETYNPTTNKCETGLKACSHGIYDPTARLCVDNFLVSCPSSGFSYNYENGMCENLSKPKCNKLYSFEPATNACRGSMKACDINYFYNKKTKECEKDTCFNFNTVNSNSRCETASLCDGTLTKIGTCIPARIQK